MIRKLEDFPKIVREGGTGIASENRLRVSVSRLILTCFSDLESQPLITVEFFAFPIDAGLVLHYPIKAFLRPVS